MSLSLGNTSISELYVGSNKIAQAYLGSNLVYQASAPAPIIPTNTVRVRTNDGNAPVKGNYTSYETATLVEGTSDVYDVYKSGDNFNSFLSQSTNVIEVLGANISNVTKCVQMFMGCSSLTYVNLFDTSNVTKMDEMFWNCSNLTNVPLLNTNSVTVMDNIFLNCTNVESGALALYQQASSQANPPTNYFRAFRNCGSNTETGAAELAQIPSDWK